MESSSFYHLMTLFFVVLISFNLIKRKRNLPPSPFLTIPFFGHLHLLKHPLHCSFQTLSKKLGPIFSLALGNRVLVVVSSPTLVEECFTKNDLVLANRPHLITSEYLGYNNSVLAIAPYGDHWRNLRRLATIEVFATARLNAFQSTREDEVRRLLGRLCRLCGNDFMTVEMRNIIFDMTLNNVMRMVAGKRYFDVDDNEDETRRFRALKDEIMLLVGGVGNPADFFPILRAIDFKGYERKLKRISEEIDGFFQRLIDEKRGNKGGNTMIDHLLSLQESEQGYYSDFTIKGFMLVFLVGGTDTSALTIEWAMTILLNNPDKLNQARSEIDSLVGNERLITESDIPKLPYFQNVISEILRLFSVAPLLLPREASADCTIGGYDIPRGTMLMVNVWSINRDPTLWEDPTSFKPERFESNNTKMMTFGMGRRSCPGHIMATRMVSLAVGSLIQCFEWERVGEEMVDLSVGKGITMSKAIPLEAKCKPRDVMLKLLDEIA